MTSIGVKLQAALRGPVSGQRAPSFLMTHQHEAFHRTSGIIALYGGACLCDAVGLGKTYVALAVASQYDRVCVLPPATIVSQWEDTASQLNIRADLTTHESLSRNAPLGQTYDLIIVDEAHRFRNDKTRRYRGLSQLIGAADVLLLTATPIVNSPRDLLNLLRLFLPDHGLAPFGVRSLADSLAGKVTINILKATTPLITARSATSAGLEKSRLPETVDARVTTFAPVCENVMHRVLATIEELEFPTTKNPVVSELLRTHLWYRLHSSSDALQSTLRRHHAYLDRAIAAAGNGHPLSRRDARLLFDLDDHQLDLDLLFVELCSNTIETSNLETEQERINGLLAQLRECDTVSPKLAHLMTLLNRRRGKRTIVFVCAIPTANHLASHLSWNRLVVVTSGRARIASGPLPLADALRLFSPGGLDSKTHPASTPIDILITTDVLSEGVNLQTADAVVHYDLPWTPLRLQQRIGRISRLGSPFQRVFVQWFLPAPSLERKLRLRNRLNQKLRSQLGLGVPVSSEVGRAHVSSYALEEREHLIRSTQPGVEEDSPCYAVVRGPEVAVYALRWIFRRGCVPDIMVTNGHDVVSDLSRICHLLRQLLGASASDQPIPDRLQAVAARVARQRLAGGLAGPANPRVQRLRKSIMRNARHLRRTGGTQSLRLLDHVLSRLNRGTRIGAELTLADLLNDRAGDLALSKWLRRWKYDFPDMHGVELDAVLFGDGSVMSRD